MSVESGQEDVPTVLVTGASGYIATHIVQQLLQTGLYKVSTVITKRKLSTQKLTFFDPCSEILKS